LHLFKEYKQGRNRPRDNRGKTLSTIQSIVQTYSHIQQLVEDSGVVQSGTKLVLITINNTTVAAW
jgi:hypothetical protein